jgi:type IV conjugative transfer system coupling protein TraD
MSDLVRTTQIINHYFRMLMQAWSMFVTLFIVSGIVITAVTLVYTTTDYERYLLKEYIIASYKPSQARHTYVTPEGKKVDVKVKSFREHPFVYGNAINIGNKLKRRIIYMLFVDILIMVIAARIFSVYGKKFMETKHLRGRELVSPATLAAEVRETEEVSEIRLADVPMPRKLEARGVAISGVSGKGKSTQLHDLLKQLRKRGDKVIVYSTSSEFISAFYEPGKGDKILNPLDERSPQWSPYNEIENPWDFDQIAASLIPEEGGLSDKFWIEAARRFVSDSMYSRNKLGDTSIKGLMDTVLSVELDELAKITRGLSVSAIVSEDSARTAQNVRSVISTYVSSLKYLRRNGEPFSIRKWLKEDESNGWCYITMIAEEQEAVRPLLTIWVSIIINTILSMKEDPSRRIWLVLDELPSLYKLRGIDKYLSEMRKYGGCGVLAFQSYAQLLERYGEKGTNVLMGLCRTKVLLNPGDPDGAEWASKTVTEHEIIRKHENLNYGANEIRDGKSVNQEQRNERLVTPGEFLTLPDMVGYLVYDSFSAAKIKYSYKKPTKLAEGVIRTSTDNLVWKEIDEAHTRNLVLSGHLKGASGFTEKQSAKPKTRKRKKGGGMAVSEETNEPPSSVTEQIPVEEYTEVSPQEKESRKVAQQTLEFESAMEDNTAPDVSDGGIEDIEL